MTNRPDVFERLQHLDAVFPAPAGGLEAMLRRHRRRQRNRKLAAMVVVGSIVALLAAIALRSAADTSEPLAPPQGGIFESVRGRIAFLDDGGLSAADPRPGGTTVPVTSVDAPPVRWSSSPLAWSPDGTRLLLDDGTVLENDGTITRLVHVPAVGGLNGGSFSPDGRSVAYSTSDGDLYIVDAAGDGAPRVLASPPAGTWLNAPMWSPDGSEIAYVEWGRHWAIAAMSPDGSDRRVIADLSDRQVGELGPAHWSPDGTQLTFSLNPTSLGDWGRIGVVSADGSQLRMLTRNDGSWGATWSPDGRRIAFVRHGHLFTMAADGTDVQRIDGADPVDFTVAWYPVG